MKSLKHIIDSC